MSFSVPRKSPGSNILANSASRMSETICEDSEAERPGTKLRADDFAEKGKTFAAMSRRIGPNAKIVKILSYNFDEAPPSNPAGKRPLPVPLARNRGHGTSLAP